MTKIEKAMERLQAFEAIIDFARTKMDWDVEYYTNKVETAPEENKQYNEEVLNTVIEKQKIYNEIADELEKLAVK